MKPEMAFHEVLFDLETSTGLPIRFAWAMLPCHADREGRFKWRPRRLGAQILPYDGIDFRRVLDALVTRGMVVHYEVGGEQYGCIPTFTDHQVINNRESDSQIPEPPELNDASSTRDPRVTHASKAEGKGMEGNGRERAPSLRSGARSPKTRELDAMKEALSEAVGYRPVDGNKAAWGPFQSAAKSLLAEGARPEDVPRVAKAYKREWPNVEMTVTALAKHWARFTRKRTNHDRPTDPRTEADLLLQEAWEHARNRSDFDSDGLKELSESLRSALESEDPVGAVKAIRTQHAI